MKRFMNGALNSARKRTIAIMLFVLMLSSILPMLLSAVDASEDRCVIEEHSHTSDCYSLICVISESDMQDAHIHSDDCFIPVCGKEAHSHNDSCLIKSVTSSDTEQTATASDLDLSYISNENIWGSSQQTLSVSGIWDYGTSSENQNIVFNSDGVSSSASIGHDNNLESDVVSIRLTAAFPDGATDKKLKITLNEGLVWVVNGASNIPESLLESVSSLSNQSTVYGQKLGNGSYTYNFAAGTETIDIEIMVKKSILTNFESISDAVTAEASCTLGGKSQSASASLETLYPQQFDILQTTNNSYSVYVKPDETVFIVGSPLVISTYTSGTGKSHTRLYDYAEMTFEAPSNITLATAANSHSGTSVYSTATSGWKLKSQETNGDVTTYVFRLEKLHTHAVGLTPEWIIPSSEYKPDDKVVVKAVKVEWKLYGDDNIYTRDGKGTLTYVVVDPNKRNEIVTAGTYRHNIQYRTDSPDAVYQLTGWCLRNTGTDASAPKVVEFEFDTEYIGVTDVTLLAGSGQNITTIWYKLKGDTEWREKSVNLSGSGTLGSILVSNVSLGLNEDDYFAALKYELDFIHNNGTPSDPSDDYRYGILPGATSVAYSGTYIPIAGVYTGPLQNGTTATSYVRVYDKTADGESVNADTGKVALKSVFSKTAYNYLQVESTQTTQASAGTTIHFSATISAFWRSSTGAAYCVGFTHYPIIYIRDETGEGISNVQLINKSGVDILSKYSDYVKVEFSHNETLDYNNDGKLAAVYKIDTRPLSSLPKEDNYAAAVGFFRSDGANRKLTLKYTITPSSTYGDGQVMHYMHDAILLSDPSVTSSSNRNTAMQFTDPYDVNQDGKTDGTSVLKPVIAHVKGYYMIISRADISVSAAIKKLSDSEYVSWDGSDNYFPTELYSEYRVKFGVFNGSGNPTSTDPDKITYVYIPIPKEGDEWGKISGGVDKDGNKTSQFTFSANLASEVSNPNSAIFDIEYANIDTSSFSASTDISLIGSALRSSSVRWGSYSQNANCIRIALKGMPSSDTPTDFVLPLVIDPNDSEKGETNILSALYFEDITDDQNRRYTGWFTSDSVSMQITWGEISGRIWKDINGNGIQESGEPGLYGHTVTLLSDGVRTSASCVTDSTGAYSFTLLSSGTYSVYADYDNDAFCLSPKDAGSSDSYDSDAAANGSQACISGISVPFADSMGKKNYDIRYADIGLVPYIDVDYKWDGEIPDSAVLPALETLASGIKYTACNVADIIGYTFAGWFTDGGLTEKFIDGTILLDDLTLHGKWTLNEYTIAFDTKGGTAIAPITQKYGTAVTAPVAPTKTGYSFKGWDKDIPDTVPAENLTITALWEINQHTVTFDTDGGSEIAPITQDYGTAVTAPAAPTKVGHTFMGWDRDIPDTIPAEDITVTALWEINQYDVTYEFAGEAPDTAVLPDGDTVDYGTAYSCKTPAAVDGYLFDGWYTDKECTAKFADGTPVTDDTVLRGKWIPNNISVSGTVEWENVPPELGIPKITIDLVLDGTIVDSIILESGETEYSFTDLDKFSSPDKPALEYTVQARPITGYNTTYSTPSSDADGNITVDITNIGTFTYGALTVSNKVAGEDAPLDTVFTYTVVFDSTAEYSYSGSASGTLKSGDTITLKDGESITISNILSGVEFTVIQDSVVNFVTTPDGGRIDSTITAPAVSADFTNIFKLPPVGNLTITNKVKGSAADKNLEFPFMVEFDDEGTYECVITRGSETATTSVRSGDTIMLAHGETAVIFALPAGISYKVTETDKKGYKLTETDSVGTILEDGSTASFVNKMNASGTSSTPDTGDRGNSRAIALYVMQIAMLVMLICIFHKKLRPEKSIG